MNARSALAGRLRPDFPATVNEPTARLGGLQTLIAAGLVLALQSPWILAWMLYEFAARVLYGPRYSLMVWIAEALILRPLWIERRAVPGPPKRFAQGVGLAFTIAALLAWAAFGFAPVQALLGILALFAGLEAFLGFCAGCFVFGGLMKAGLIPQSVCDRCVW